MRLSAVAESPNCAGNDREESDHPGFSGRNQRKGIFTEGIGKSSRLHIIPDIKVCSDRHNNNGKEHQRALNQVRPTDCKITTEDRVDQHDRHPDQHGIFIFQSEHHIEKFAAGNKPGSGVNRKEAEDHNGRKCAEDPVLFPEPVFKEGGERHGICLFRIDAETGCNEDPVQDRTNCQPDGDPGFAKTCHINSARQPHEQPAAHIARLRGKGCHPGADTASAEEVLCCTFDLCCKNATDCDHDQQINAEHDIGGIDNHAVKIPFSY